MLLFCFILLAAGIIAISYYLLPSLLNKTESLQSKRAKRVSIRLENAFIFVGGKKLNLLYAGLFVGLGAAGFLLFKLPGLLAGAGISVVIPLIAVKSIVAKRKKKFDSQIIDTLMIISSCLKGGLSLVQSFEAVGEEMPPPVSEEFGLVTRETKVGVSLEEALRKLNKRMQSDDLDLIISSILVARETGGDLTKVFFRLIDTIRDHTEIKEMASSLTMQGRMQGIIMSIIPIVFTIVILKFNPGHFDILLEDDTGKMMLAAAVVMQILALFCIKKFSTIKV